MITVGHITLVQGQRITGISHADGHRVFIQHLNQLQQVILRNRNGQPIRDIEHAVGIDGIEVGANHRLVFQINALAFVTESIGATLQGFCRQVFCSFCTHHVFHGGHFTAAGLKSRAAGQCHAIFTHAGIQ